MTDPTRKRQLEELDQVTLCTRILFQARSELYVNMKFLDVSLSSLGFEADWAREGLGTDGHLIYYGPDYLLGLYKKGRTLVNRGYLHMLFHCLFCHMYTRKDRDKGYWDLSCDIAMEYVIDGLYQKCVHVPRSALRREIYLRLEKALSEKGPVLTAERVYRALLEMELPDRRLDMLKAEFFVDSHDLWEQEDSPKIARSRQNKWNDNREKMQTELETGSKDASEDNRSLLEEVQVENRERYDYSRFLQKFAVLKEEMQVDPDSFDYAFYTYGLSLYGNMPLIEPLESREVYRVEDFAIVIDTSMSCSGELVRRFLEETYDVLSETESYFKKVHLHIIQCDDAVQSDVLVTSQEELKAYMDDFQIRGSGLKKSRRPASLKGLIYFTDGKGIYPVQAPSYDTAFVFIENMFSDESVPPWAMKVVLEEEQLMEYRPGSRNRDTEADQNRRNGEMPAGQDSRNRHGQ